MAFFCFWLLCESVSCELFSSAERLHRCGSGAVSKTVCMLTCDYCLFLFQPDDTVNVAIEKINALLETFLGISDTELGKVSVNLQHHIRMYLMLYKTLYMIQRTVQYSEILQ